MGAEVTGKRRRDGRTDHVVIKLVAAILSYPPFYVCIHTVRLSQEGGLKDGMMISLRPNTSFQLRYEVICLIFTPILINL